MKYVADVALCAGHGQCHAAAPDVHPLDDDGFHALAGKPVDVAPEHEKEATAGARACPESAITLLD